MKRTAAGALLLFVATLGGCPIYSHENGGCFRNSDCAPDYSCDDLSGVCYLSNGNACSVPEDCGLNQTCDRNAQCSFGDCSFKGCVAGYRCDSSSGVWGCVLDMNGAAGSPSQDGSSGAAGAEAAGAGPALSGGAAGAEAAGAGPAFESGGQTSGG